MEIETVVFSNEGIRILENKDKGTNWPVVYIIHNDEIAYIGETCDIMGRLFQHISVDERKKLDRVEIIVDDEFNKSAVLDIEQKLIRLCKADGRFKLQNRNAGQSSSHEYFNRIHYEAMISEIWEKMLDRDLAITPHGDLVNAAIYKYSPYTSMTTEQMQVYSQILNDITKSIANKREGTFVVHGSAGTGKTILAMTLLRTLVNSVKQETDELIIDSDEDVSILNGLVRTLKKYLPRKPKVAFCTPVSELRSVLETVVSSCDLGDDLVVSPEEIAQSHGEPFDVVIIDESHRLKIRKNIQNYKLFDECSRHLGLNPYDCSQLDWII